jgi:hypothetical protein
MKRPVYISTGQNLNLYVVTAPCGCVPLSHCGLAYAMRTNLSVGMSWCSVIMGGRLFILCLVVCENSEQLTNEEYTHIHVVYGFCHGDAWAVVDT